MQFLLVVQETKPVLVSTIFMIRTFFFCIVEIDMFPGCFRILASGISTLSFTFIGTTSAKIAMFWSRHKRFFQVAFVLIGLSVSNL